MNSVDLRCPNCGALARGGAAWCTLCHADLHPPQAPPQQPDLAPGTPSAVAGLDPLTAPLDQLLAAVDADADAAQAAQAVPPVDAGSATAPTAPTAPTASTASTAQPVIRPELLENLPPELALAIRAEFASAAPDADPVESADPAGQDDARIQDLTDTDVMFALLRGESQDPLLAKYGGQLETKTSRFAFMVVGAGVLAVLFFGVMALLGLVLG